MVIVLEETYSGSSSSFTSIDMTTLQSGDYWPSTEEALQKSRIYTYRWVVEEAMDNNNLSKRFKIVYPIGFTEEMLVNAVIKHKQTFPELYL